MYLLGAVLGGLAILVPRLQPAAAYALAVVLAVAGLIAIGLLERAPYERQIKKPKQPSAAL